MSLLTPVKVPVKIYRWDDVGAPSLDKTPGCVMRIFEACLVTGYGTKESSGWTMPFEDANAGVKVLRPEVGPHTDFYLRMSSDNGSTVAAALKTDVTDINNGSIIGELATPFRYNFGDVSKWQMLCTGRTIWFFANVGAVENKKGIYFLCGDTAANSVGARAVYIRHTAGTWGSTVGSRGNIFENIQNGLGGSYGQLFDPTLLTTTDATPNSWFSSSTDLLDETLLSRAVIISAKRLWALPIYGSSSTSNNSFDKIFNGEDSFINNPTNPQTKADNTYVKLDYWEY